MQPYEFAALKQLFIAALKQLFMGLCAPHLCTLQSEDMYSTNKWCTVRWCTKVQSLSHAQNDNQMCFESRWNRGFCSAVSFLKSFQCPGRCDFCDAPFFVFTGV